MTAFAFVAAMILVVVFATSGLTKIARPAQTAVAAREMGVPNGIAVPIGWMLPVLELAVVVGLLVPGGLLIAAAIALLLLLAFTVTIAAALLTNHRPVCRCFGALRPTRISLATLIRNTALMALTLPLLLGRHSSVWQTTPRVTARDGLSLLAIVLTTALVVVAWFLVNLAQQHGRLLARLEQLEARMSVPHSESAVPAIHGLPVGTVAPKLELRDSIGRSVMVSSRWATQPGFLIFLDQACGPCQELAPSVLTWIAQRTGQITVTAITPGTWLDDFARNLPCGAILHAGRDAAEAFGCPGTPAGVLVGTDGRIAAQPALGPDAIRKLVTGLLSKEVVLSASTISLITAGTGVNYSTGSRNDEEGGALNAPH